MTDPAAPPVLATASWFTHLPKGFVRIGIARGPFPRGVDLNTMRYPGLIPLHSQKSLEPAVYHRHYLAKLAALDPEVILAELVHMGGTRVPVLCAWIMPDTIARGQAGCHRHLAAAWLERALDIHIPEFGAPPSFDRLRYWRAHPIVPGLPGDRPRTDQPRLRISQAEQAAARLAQGKLKI